MRIDRHGRAGHHVGAHEQDVVQLQRIARVAVAAAGRNFSTGIDSPVIAAWLTNRSLALSTRQSAGIMSPADSTIRSPGTSCLIGSSIHRFCSAASLLNTGRGAITRSTVACC